MTAEELVHFINVVRADIDCAIIEMAAIDFEDRPGDYDDDLRGWVELRRLSDQEIVELVGAAWNLAGRELSLDELFAQLGLHYWNSD